jgi:DNA-binding CsgD family transcriptional regulator
MMKLIEREGVFKQLQSIFQNITEGDGQCVFISGEAGMGKTSVVNAFCRQHKNDCDIFRGACDALFTPRPLAPLFDIIWQVNNQLWPDRHNLEERTELFASFFRELRGRSEKMIIVFEDIHWADEATLDFIKFLARRISQLHCLFILTYRDDDVASHYALRAMLGQLPPHSFIRLPLKALSRDAVKQMAEEKGFNGEEVYQIAGGNPFYVTEILSSYSLGVPDSIRDAILSAHSRTDEGARQVWDLLSVIPTSFEVKYLEKFQPLYATAIENCLNHQILLIQDGFISFKHELFRRTIESSLSPLKRLALNKKILELLREVFEQNGEIERIIHHAKNANDYDTVYHYAPMAAKQAASVGAHTEAARLYLSAIEYHYETDKDLLLQLYEGYAYECYLTNQVKEAIIYTTKSLNLWKEKAEPEKIGNSYCFLSRLWWIEDNLKNAENAAGQAIEVLESQPASHAKARAYSLMSQLKMFSDLPEECVYWGEKAISMATALSDYGILSYALGNVGSIKIRKPANQQQGLSMLKESLRIALQNSFPDYAGMAYTNLAYNGVIIKDYRLAKEALDSGIPYCDENDLDLWRLYLLTVKAKYLLETGDWSAAYEIAGKLAGDDKPAKIIKIYALTILAAVDMRQRDNEQILTRLNEAKESAFETAEPQRIIQALTTFLEYEWIRDQHVIEKELLDTAIKMTKERGNIYGNSEFAFWLYKARGQRLELSEIYEGFDTGDAAKAKKTSRLWKQAGCSYNEALTLFAGTDEDKREAVTLVQALGADNVFQKMKSLMRSSGMKSIPRGLQKSTQSNPAQLTRRELDILQLMREGLQNKEIAGRLFISAKTVDNHISSILFKLDSSTRAKAVNEAVRLEILK